MTSDLSRRSFLAGAATLAVASRAAADLGPSVSIASFGAVPGRDALPAIRAALAAIVSAGGGTLDIPESGQGGWLVSDCVVIASSNVHIRLFDDVRLSKRSASSVFVFSGPDAAHPIRNVSIAGRGARPPRIDGNGRNMTQYVYKTSDTFHSCILFRWCSDWQASNIYGYNGLVNCLRAYQCGPGRFIDCASSDSRFDNGQSIDFDPSAAGATGAPAGWARSSIVRARAWRCAGFGVTVYAATGVEIVDAQVWDCGNDDPDAPVAGGGISVEADYFAPGRAAVDHHVRVIRPRIARCRNSGMFITAHGVFVDRPEISETLVPVRRHSDPLKITGSNIYCLSACSLEVVGGLLRAAGTNGIMAWGAGGYRPRVKFDGTIEGSRQYGMFELRSEPIVVTPRSKITNSGVGRLRTTAETLPTEILPLLIPLRTLIGGPHAVT